MLGDTKKSNIVKSNPFKKTVFVKKCPICQKGIDCQAPGVHYRIKCGDVGCKDAQYERETTRSRGERNNFFSSRTKVTLLTQSKFHKMEFFCLTYF